MWALQWNRTMRDVVLWCGNWQVKYQEKEGKSRIPLPIKLQGYTHIRTFKRILCLGFGAKAHYRAIQLFSRLTNFLLLLWVTAPNNGHANIINRTEAISLSYFLTSCQKEFGSAVLQLKQDWRFIPVRYWHAVTWLSSSRLTFSFNSWYRFTCETNSLLKVHHRHHKRPQLSH